MESIPLTLTTEIITLPLTTRAANALNDQCHHDQRPAFNSARAAASYARCREKTRREIARLVNALRLRFPDISPSVPVAPVTTSESEEARTVVVGIDLLCKQINNLGHPGKKLGERAILYAFLGLEDLAMSRPRHSTGPVNPISRDRWS